MGVGDGTFQGVTPLLVNGDDSSRKVIALVAEGFQDTEQDDFNDACDDFIAALQAEPWYAVLGEVFNIYRVNVASTDSGTDMPATCPDGETGPGTTAATYFDSTFCNSGIWRCLSGNEGIVEDLLDAELPGWDQAVVLVNSTERGGCRSGNVAWSALSSDWTAVSLHELGHAAFGLGDEYNYWEGCDSGETSQDHAPPGEPGYPNVTTVTDRNLLKWKEFVGDEIPIPTMENPDCSECDDRDNVLDDDTTIGLFEGAGYYHCGRYRPAYTCRMRSSLQPFCRVCVDAMVAEVNEYIPGTAHMEVVPSSLDFGDVGIGLTMFRGFEVRNVRIGMPTALHVELTPPTGPFSFPDDTELSFTLPAPVYEPYTSKTIWVAFTGSSDPDVPGEVVVTSDDETNPEATVTLAAHSVEPPPVDSVLVMDRSGSMSDATGVPGASKIDLAIEAANLYVSLLKDNDRIGVVRYDHRWRDPEDILLSTMIAGDPDTGAGRAAAREVLTISNLTPDGSTSVGGGIILGSGVLDGGTADSRALVVLTDGRQNTDPEIADGTATVLTTSPAQRVFAVGLGLNQLEDKLHEIATVTNGVAQITGDLVGDREFILQKLYVQILSDVADEAFVTDPRLVLRPGRKQATTIHIGEVDVAADFILVHRAGGVFPKYLRVWLEAPDGTLISPADVAATPNVEYFLSGRGHQYFRWLFPAFPDRPEAHVGPWRFWVENFASGNITAGPTTLYYSIMAKARSNFRLGGRIDQAQYKPGSTMRIVLEPTLYGMPVELDEPVRVTITRPDGAERIVWLELDEHGSYLGYFDDTWLVGPYHAVANVTTTTPAGDMITRYRQMTGLIYIPGLTGGGDDGGLAGARCCKEVIALLRRLVVLMERSCRHKPQLTTDELLKALKERIKGEEGDQGA